MQLKDWFTDLRGQRLSKKEKASMYASILHKTQKNKHFFTKRLEFYLKAWSLTTILLIWAIYFTTGYLPQSTQNFSPESGPVVIDTPQRNNIVQADTLWKLINVEWSIEIFDWDEQIAFTDEIFNWHKVYLQEGARVELVVRQWVKAIITWPAQFLLERLNDDTIVLNLIDGSYFEIVPIQTAEEDIFNDSPTAVSNNTDTSISTRENTDENNSGSTAESEQTQERKVDNLIVKTQDFEIQQMPAQRNLRVKVTKDENGVSTLENQGADIIIKRLENDNETVEDDRSSSRLAVLGRDQVALVNKNTATGEVTITQSESDQIEGELRERQLTIRYEADEDIVTVWNNNAGDTSQQEGQQQDADSTNWRVSADGLENPNTNPNTPEDTQTQSEWNWSENAKSVLAPATTQAVQESIKISFIKKHVTDIAVYQFNWNDEQKQVALRSLAAIITRARWVFDLPASPTSIDGVVSSTNQLVSHIEKRYFVWPTLQSSLDRVQAIVERLQSVWYNQTDQTDYNASLEALRQAGFSVENL